MALTDKLLTIGDAILAKTGKSESMTLTRFPQRLQVFGTGHMKRGISMAMQRVMKNATLICMAYLLEAKSNLSAS